MSSFYFCDKCQKPTDLIFNELTLEMICKYCHDTNWHAEIDKAVEQLKEKILNESVSGYSADIVDKNFKELLSK